MLSPFGLILVLLFAARDCGLVAVRGVNCPGCCKGLEMRSSRKFDVAGGSDGVLEELKALDRLGFAELKARFGLAYGSDCRASKELMRLALGFEAQVNALGGLGPEDQKVLAGAVAQIESFKSVGRPSRPVGELVMPSRPKPAIKPGTRFVREWGGKFHEVIALETGQFAYEGRLYGSLSEIAGVITGAKWSGPRFFGLKKAKSSKRGSSHD